MAKKEIKFTEEELGSINDLRSQIGSLFAKIGQLHLEKKRRDQQVEQELLSARRRVHKFGSTRIRFI